MARVTISPALDKMDSKYELGMLATQRVRDLNGGAEPIVPVGNDKPTVTALREIASGNLDIGHLRHEFVQSHKSAPIADDSEVSIESQSEDPLLKELDAELEDAIIETPMEEEELGNELDEPLGCTQHAVGMGRMYRPRLQHTISRGLVAAQRKLDKRCERTTCPLHQRPLFHD